MICPDCHTPNPEGTALCLQSTGDLSDPGEKTVASSPDAMPTMAAPKSLKDLQQARPGQALSSPSLSLPPGFEIGRRYRVRHLLGRGGMGTVYQVDDIDLSREVALKLIRNDIAENTLVLERFKREIQLSSKITHRNVLRVYDLGEADGVQYLTMQFIAGGDLASLLKRERHLPMERVLKIFKQVCEGLEAAHEQGVVHRDLKPQNVMLGSGDHVYLTDFGLAKTLEQSGMTQTGAVVGTPYYMSPEQVKGEPAGPRSDIYSLGIILYEMVTGSVPYGGNSVYEVMIQRLQKPPRPPRELNPQIPGYVEKILERCLAVDPNARYQTVREILTDLESGTFHTTMKFELHKRRWLRPAAAGLVIVAVLGLAGWWLRGRLRPSAPQAARKPESVLITDFVNKTGDPVFDGTLEPSLGLALEGASFLTTYNRGQARKIAAQLQPGATSLTEALGRLVAVREGIQVVTAGSIETSGSGYRIEAHALDPTTGKAIRSEEATAASKDAVLGSVAKLATGLRAALGDTTPKALQLAAAETYTAGSLEAAHEYALAQDFQYGGKYGEAVPHYLKAIERDPDLGRAYAGIAVLYSNQGRKDEAEKYYQLAMAKIDRMSDREKFRTRGGYYLIVRRDPDKAIEEYGQLVQRYPADTAGISNLALAYFYKRDMAKSLAEGRRAIEIYPKNVPQRNNVGLYAMYASDFETAIREQNEVIQMNPRFVLAYVGLALSQLAQGHPDLAADTWKKASAIDARGASDAALGLADLALHQGKPTDAVPLLEKGIDADVAASDPGSAAVKLVALAEARLAQGQAPAALAAADRAVALAKGENVQYPAARVYLEAGKDARALEIARALSQRLEPDPQAYAELLKAEASLRQNKPRDAIRVLEGATKLADTWMGRYLLGRAYFEAGVYPDADRELEACAKRRGEATALFLDEGPTVRYAPPAVYWLGRAREALKSPAAAESYKAFVAIKDGGEDPLLADARKRLGGK
jgi:tetratricopeptide (TPR) repeat protein/tRNA A-37 threonylcarbamoyl transferase component Bud32